MAVTNQLEIDIKAKSDKATSSLDNLIAKLNEVNTALNGLNTAKITEISKGLKGLKGVHIKPGGGSGSGGSSGGSSSNNASIKKTSTLLDLLSSSSKRANIGILNFRGSMLKLAAAWGTFYAAMYPVIRLFKLLGSQVENSMDYVETYNYFIVTMNKIGHDAGEEFSNGFMSQIKALDQKMTGFKIGENGELFESGEKSLGIDPNALMQFQARIGAVTNSVGLMGETSIATQKALSMLSSDLSSLKNEDLESVMNNLSSGLIGQSRALYKYGIDITNATLKTYAYEHGVTKAVSAMTQSEKLQLRVLAILDQSKIAWGDQANTINSVANQYRLMKQQISNLGRVIGNLFLPIVQKVLPYLNAFIIALRRIGELVGLKIFGSDWQKNLNSGVSSGNFDGIEEGAEDAADAMDDATKSAKKLKQATMGFDELNIISQDSSSGSGSGSGGGGSIDLSDDINAALAEYEKVWNDAFNNMANKAEELADKFMSFVEAKDWFGLGRWLADGLEGLLEDIPWNSIYQGAKDFGKGLAQFLNGLISPSLFYDVGKTIANSLNTAIYATWEFAKNFDFSNLGVAIGNYINGFFQNFDFAALAQDLNAWVDGLETAIGSALDTIKWKDVFKGLYDFVSNLEIDTVGAIVGVLTIKKVGKVAIGEAIGTFISGKLKALLTGISIKELGINILKIVPSFAGTAAFDTVAFEIVGQLDIALSKLAPKLSHALGKLLQGAVEGGVAGSWIPGIGTIAGAIVGSLAEALNDFNPKIFKFEWTKYWWDECIKSFKRAFNSKDLIEFGGNIFEGIIEGFVTAITFITEPISQFFVGICEALANKFDMHSPAKNMYPFGKNIFLGILEGFKSQFGEWGKAIEDWYNNHVKPWFTKEKWQQLGNDVKSGLGEKWIEISTNVATTWENIKTTIGTKWGEIKTDTAAKWDEIKSDLDSKWEDTKTKASETWQNLKDTIGTKWSEIKDDTSTKWSDIKSDLGDKWSDIKSDANSKWSEMKSNIATRWTEVKNDTSTKWSNIKSDLGTKWSDIKSNASIKWSEMKSNITTRWSEIKTDTSAKWGTIKTDLLGKWETLKTNSKTKFGDVETNIVGAWNNIKEGMTKAWDEAIETIKTAWNNFANWLNEKLTWRIDPVVVAGKTLFEGTTINLGKIPTFAMGGFPEDGLFFANHSELVGQFSNGQTAVANNEQIIEGIRSGVASAVREELGYYLRDIADNTNATANNTEDIKNKPNQTLSNRDIARANRIGSRSMGLTLRTT